MTNDIHKLDLNAWTWSKLEPKGTRPLRSSDMTSWVSGEKMFLFGGLGEGREAGEVYPQTLQLRSINSWYVNNQLVFYDCRDDSWNWPLATGRVLEDH